MGRNQGTVSIASSIAPSRISLAQYIDKNTATNTIRGLSPMAGKTSRSRSTEGADFDGTASEQSDYSGMTPLMVPVTGVIHAPQQVQVTAPKSNW